MPKNVASDSCRLPFYHQKELFLSLLLNYFNVETNYKDISLRNRWLHLIFIILTHNLPKLVIKITNTAKVDFKHPIYRLLCRNLP